MSTYAALVASAALLVMGVLVILGLATDDDVSVVVGGTLMAIGALTTRWTRERRAKGAGRRSRRPDPEAPLCESCGRALSEPGHEPLGERA
jgi:hypothetical protein